MSRKLQEAFIPTPNVFFPIWPNEHSEGLIVKVDQDENYSFPEESNNTDCENLQGTDSSVLPSEVRAEIVLEGNHGHDIRTETNEPLHITNIRNTIFQNLQKEAKERILLENMDFDTVTFAEQCTTICCRSCICDFKVAFSRTKTERTIYFDDMMTPILRRGRAQGWGMYKHIIYPLIPHPYRAALVTAHLLASFLILLLSSTALSLNETRASIYVVFASAFLSSILAILDATFTLWSWDTCKNCRTFCKKGRLSQEMVISNISQTRRDITNIQNQQKTLNKTLPNPESVIGATEQKRNKFNFPTSQTILNIIRIILSELFTYIFIICGIFEAILGQGKTNGNKISLVMLSVSGISLLAFVYITRLVILVRTVKHVQAIRRLPFQNKKSMPQTKSSISSRGLYYQAYLVVHAAFQMVIQISIFIAVGGKVAYDNRQFLDKSAYNDNVFISGHLWCMILTGYFIPIFGTLTGFATTFFWAQEFFIGLCIDLATILKINTINYSEDKDLLDGVNKFLSINSLIKDYHILRKKKIWKKCLYPFRTPTVVALSITYAALASAFIISGGISSNQGPLESQILNGSAWIVSYIFTIILLVAGNVYTIFIALFWTTVMIAFVVALLVMLTAVIFGLAMCCNKKQYLNHISQ